MSKEFKSISQQIMADMWDSVIPPPDGQIVINRLGTVCMSYKTLQKFGYECNDTSEVFKEWKREWEEKSNQTDL